MKNQKKHLDKQNYLLKNRFFQQVQTRSELFMIENGSGNITIDGNLLHVENKQVILILKGQNVSKVNTKCSGYSLIVSDSDFENYQKNGEPFLVYKELLEIARTRPLFTKKYFNKIQDLLKIYNSIEMEKILSSSKPLFIQIILKIFYHSKFKVTVKTSKLIDRFVFLIDRNYFENLSVKDYAAKLFVSESKLRKECHQILNKSPRVVINDARLNYLKKEIAARDCNLSEIATKFNFYDRSHFTKFFKERTGCRPRDYRLQWLRHNNF